MNEEIKNRITDAFEELSAQDQEILYEKLAAAPVIATIWQNMIKIVDDQELNEAMYKILELVEEVFDAID